MKLGFSGDFGRALGLIGCWGYVQINLSRCEGDIGILILEDVSGMGWLRRV